SCCPPRQGKTTKAASHIVGTLPEAPPYSGHASWDAATYSAASGHEMCPKSRYRCTCNRDALVRHKGCGKSVFQPHRFRKTFVERDSLERSMNRMCDIPRPFRPRYEPFLKNRSKPPLPPFALLRYW